MTLFFSKINVTFLAVWMKLIELYDTSVSFRFQNFPLTNFSRYGGLYGLAKKVRGTLVLVQGSTDRELKVHFTQKGVKISCTLKPCMYICTFLNLACKWSVYVTTSSNMAHTLASTLTLNKTLDATLNMNLNVTLNLPEICDQKWKD